MVLYYRGPFSIEGLGLSFSDPKKKQTKKKTGVSKTRGRGLFDTYFLYFFFFLLTQSRISPNRPRSIYQYSNMGPRLSGLTSIFGVVFFVSKSPLGIEGQKKL